MTETEVNHAFHYAKHSLELEGLNVTQEDENVMKAVFTGRMSREQLIQQLTE
ncbi:MAG: hypothetical protein ABF586_09200 [Sporolactobacillus sp.]